MVDGASRHHRLARVALVAAVFAASGCGGGEKDSGPICEDSPERVTYHGTVRALVERRCVTCHREGGIGPFSLDSWTNVSRFADSMLEQIDLGHMPPAQADPACREMDRSRYLPADERALMHAWVDGGSLEGDVCAYEPPPPPPPEPSPEGEPDVILTFPEPIELSDEHYDDYHWKVLDHVFEEEVFVLATEFVSEHPEMVHHATVFTVEDDLPELVMGAVPMIGGQVPGTKIFSAPAGAAMRIPAGYRVAVDLHYHARKSHSGELPTDRPQVRIWTLPAGETPEFVSESVVATAHEFVLPAGDPDVVVEETFPLPENRAQVWAFLPHMHTRGVGLRGEILRAGGETDCAIDVVNYDFRWQLVHRLPPGRTLEIGPDDRLRIFCRYDNSAENQPIVDGVRLPPEDVHEGPGSLDEMCQLQLFRLVPYAP